MGLKRWISDATAFVMRLKVVRVMLRYGSYRGPLLAAGLSYQAIFAVFAAIWVGFAIAGFIIRARPALQQAFFDFISLNVPGLIDTGGGGVIDPTQLLSASILGWTGAVAAGGLLLTALGWLASGRDAVRTLFGMPHPATNVVLLKLKDLLLALGFGAIILVSTALSVFGAQVLSWLFEVAGVNENSVPAEFAARAVGLLLVLIVDTVLLGSFYRVVSGIHIPLRLLMPGTVLAAIALGVLKALGTSLLGGATHNPLLASFVAIIGLLIWFNFVCQVVLIGAAWIAVSASDRGIDLNEHRTEHGTPSGTALPL
ncbi:YhjD/YihY/BrkB family envelope integrity protein [Leifsonia sp. H3M29-4]|uniref:YihY/virulence factor BrkB family protein n=1 Tax=Salinibacterium metalliresistens TaxID=3031321 RepID=UPI0023DAA490|nr:YhjD/YihY/BrkB family envelope integrity protein [Salinibacterium metalliresistens]MDF1479103.1 YhjD/YihY/BrkB family envelope integrity protein [Salinibacterium metalliresistens]